MLSSRWLRMPSFVPHASDELAVVAFGVRMKERLCHFCGSDSKTSKGFHRCGSSSQKVLEHCVRSIVVDGSSGRCSSFPRFLFRDGRPTRPRSNSPLHLPAFSIKAGRRKFSQSLGIRDAGRFPAILLREPRLESRSSPVRARPVAAQDVSLSRPPSLSK